MSATVPGIVLSGISVDDWLELGEDGCFVVRSGKAEIGTGLATALVQVVAEELEVDPESVRIAQLRTGLSPDEGYTAGSRSIRDSSPVLRQVAAETRHALIGRAAERLGLDAARLVMTSSGVSSDDGRSVPFRELLAAGRFDVVTTGAIAPRDPATYRVVGTDLSRRDALAKVTGGAAFVSDVRLEGMRHARVLRPPRNGAHRLDVDRSRLPAGVELFSKGDFLAVVAATEGEAVSAASAVSVRWSDDELLPPQAELFDRMRSASTVDRVLREGQVEDGLASADTIVDRSYEWPFQAHASIGPACAVADVRDGRAIVHAAAQGVYPLQRGLAALLGLPTEAVTVVHGEGPGCYGHNGADDVAADAAVLSQALGYPVRVQWSREDEHVWARKGPAMVVRIRAGIDSSGNMLAVDTEVWTPTHGGRAQRPERFTVGHLLAGEAEAPDTNFVGGERNAEMDYTIPAHRVTMHWLESSILPSSSLRALGAVANTFGNESLIDELAFLAGADPVEYRLRHIEDPRGCEVIVRAAEAADWGEEIPAGQGRGIAYARYENTGAYLAAVAHVAVDPVVRSVEVLRIVIAQDCGLIINPDGVRNQVEGNVLQSLSRALMEEVLWQPTGITTRDWETYPILRFSEVPAVEVVLIDRPDQPALGVGEPASITTAPALANAIAAACGERVRRGPLVPGGRLRQEAKR